MLVHALLTNTTRELQYFHLATRTHEVIRRVPTQTVSGEVGVKVVRYMVPSTITFLPGERKRVSDDVLDSLEVQRAINDTRVLKMVELNAAPPEKAKLPTPPSPKPSKRSKASTRRRRGRTA